VGDRDAARTHYEQVLANLKGGDADLPEVAEAKAYVSNPPQPTWSGDSRVVGGGVALIGLAASIAIYRRMRRGATALAPVSVQARRDKRRTRRR
jgi:hypothetical protein